MSQQPPDYRQHYIDQFNALAAAFSAKLKEQDTRGCKEIVDTEIILYSWIEGLPDPDVKFAKEGGLEDDDPGELEPDTPDKDRAGRFYGR